MCDHDVRDIAYNKLRQSDKKLVSHQNTLKRGGDRGLKSSMNIPKQAEHGEADPSVRSYRRGS